MPLIAKTPLKSKGDAKSERKQGKTWPSSPKARDAVRPLARRGARRLRAPLWAVDHGVGSDLGRLNCQLAGRTVPDTGATGSWSAERARHGADCSRHRSAARFHGPGRLRSGTLLQVLPDWKSVGTFAEHLYAIRPYSAHVPRAVTVFVAFQRQALAGGFTEDIRP
jgi:hypothetical protein